MNLNEEEIEFMKNYVERGKLLVEIGLLGEQEVKICKLFVKILQNIEGSDNNEKNDSI